MWWRSVLVLVVTWSWTACGGDDGDDVPVEPDAGVTFDPDDLWGPPDTPPPPGAETIPAEEMADLIESGEIEVFTSAEWTSAITDTEVGDAEARALVEAVAAADPRLAYVLPAGVPDGDTVHDVGGEPTTLHGRTWLFRETADSFTRTSSRANREASITSLLGALSPEQRAAVPALGTLDDVALATLERDVIRWVDTQASIAGIAADDLVPPAELAHAHGPPEEGVYQAATGCRHQINGAYMQLSWQLKAFATRPRVQGSRGTCAAQAIAGTIETHLMRTRGLRTDFSEQELYARAKGVYFPTADAYDDGLASVATFEQLIDRDVVIDPELDWRYNRSPNRTEDDAARVYTHSCDDYDETCSDTNHQIVVACAITNNQLVCGRKFPASVQGGDTNGALVTDIVSLWNPIEPENSVASIRAHLNAGHPVTLGVTVDDGFMDAQEQEVDDNGSIQPGEVNQTFYDVVPDGGHLLQVVGYIPNAAIEALERWQLALTPGLGGGYLVVKNSWGCDGDGGMAYLSYAWVVQRAHSAAALTGVTSLADVTSGTLEIDRSSVTSPGSVTLTAHHDARARRIRIYRGLGNDQPILDVDVAGGAPGEVSALDGFVDEGQNNLYSYWARITDSFGNSVATNVATVLVMIDDADPEITLAALEPTVIAPGAIRLRATASDEVSGIASVRFYRGFQLIRTDTAAPYTADVSVGLGDVGEHGFVAIATDGAGHTEMSARVDVTVTGQLRPIIGGFTATPTQLAWQVAGADAVSISTIGAVASSGTRAIAPTQTTTYVLTATNEAGTSFATATAHVPVALAPIVTSFTATPPLVTPGGTVRLAWNVFGPGVTVAIDGGVGAVAQSGTVEVPGVTAATTFTLTATNANGTSTRAVAVAVGADTTPPVVTLTASPSTTVLAPGTVALIASAADAGGIARVELYRGAERIAVDDTPANGFVFGATFAAADVGSHGFTARALDASGNDAESATVTITVALPPPDPGSGDGDRHVDPTGSDAGNDCTQGATPCRTIARAISVASPGDTVWLDPGDYDEASPVVVDRSLAIRGTGAGVRVGVELVVTAPSTITNLVLDRDVGPARIRTTSGSTTVSGVTLDGAFSGTSALRFEGSSIVTLAPPAGIDRNLAAETLPGDAALVEVAGSATLTIAGAMFEGPGVGTAASPGAIVVRGGTLHLDGDVELYPVTYGLAVINGTVDGTLLAAATDIGTGWGLRLGAQAPTDMAIVDLVDSDFDGFATGIEVSATRACVLTLTRALVRNNDVGLGYQDAPDQVLVVRDSSFTGNDIAVWLETGEIYADLGTADTDGNNVLQNNTLAIHVEVYELTEVYAVGNTWTVAAQGADDFGHYTSVVGVNGGDGPNYRVISGELVLGE